MRTLRTIPPVFVGMFLAWAVPSARAALAYDNTTASRFNSFGTLNPDVATFGDYVTLAGGATTITAISFLVSANQDNGNPEADFGLFVYDDDAGAVGTLAGSAFLNGYTFAGNGTYTVSFPGLSIPVAGNKVFVGLSIGNYNGDDTFNDFIGVEMYDPPTLGSSDPESMVLAFGVGLNAGQVPLLTLTPAGERLNNIAMTISVVPEPGTWAVTCSLGLLGLAWWRRRGRFPGGQHAEAFASQGIRADLP